MISFIAGASVIFPPIHADPKDQNLLEFYANPQMGVQARAPVGSFMRAVGEVVTTSDGTRTPSPPVGITVFFHHYYSPNDGPSLYAFPERGERQMFRQLLRIDKIGGTSGLKILSATHWTTIQQMLDAGDAKGITKLPGVGPKSGARIVEAMMKVPVSDKPSTIIPVNEDVIGALGTLGIPRAKAVELLNAVTKSNPGISDDSALLTLCLQAHKR